MIKRMMMMRSVPRPMYMVRTYPGATRLNAPPPVCVPTYSVSIMEFADEHVVHETQYFADTFQAPAWRAALAEPAPGRT